VFALLLSAVFAEAGELNSNTLGPSVIGIDHIPIAVKDLDQTTNSYQKLGFSLKPGVLHGNGIRNSHLKFKDGSGLELISPPSTSRDELTGYYLNHLKQGDGPAYVSFHARDTDKLLAALTASGFDYRNDGVITLKDPRLKFIFFVKDNRSPTDKPEHFVHPNFATAMTGVWLALDDKSYKSVSKLLTALGAAVSEDLVFVPNAVKAKVFTVQNGYVVLLPKSHQLHAKRQVVGVTFQIRHNTHVTGDRRRLLVSPITAHGLWLDLREAP
jgi:catechol 2,3-dioxygenase-like lactoylglutathione lyase family enzyme